MSEHSVLYDVPGPRARRLTIIFSVVAALAVAAVAYFFVYRPLADQGQFSMEKWGPLIDPGNENFSLLWDRIRDGFVKTLTAAGLAIAASLVLGTALAVLRVQLKELRRRRFASAGGVGAAVLRGLTWALNAITRLCVEVFRGTPVVITLVFVWLGLPVMGIDFDNVLWYLVIGLTIYNMVVIAEILRSGMEGLPGGQSEAASALGLTSFQAIRMILLPQAFRIMLPALISQLVVVLKDTSLGFIISYEEILRITNQVIQVLNNPIQMYVVIGGIYIVVNYALSKLAAYTQRRLARGRKTPTTLVERPPAAIVAEVEAGSSVT
jgi:glutamate transport system permease protein